MTEEHPSVVDLNTAARITGRTRKAIAHRVERGQVRYVLQNGKRYIPVSELVRAELLNPTFEPLGAAMADAGGSLGLRPIAPAPAAPNSPTLDVLVLLREQIEANQRQAEEIGRMKAITTEVESLRLRSDQEHAEVDRLQQALLEQRARITELEAAALLRRRWWNRTRVL